MKYIRTKDKKGKQYIINDRDYLFLIDDNKVIFGRGYYEELLGQADTIEELCDEFVRVSKSVHDFLVSDDIPTKKFADTEIYGAIWTDKGLIYAAKMNDKGELCLI